MRVTNSKIKFLTKDQNSYASKIPFIDNLKTTACALKWEVLELVTLRYVTKICANLSMYSRKPGNYIGTIIFEIDIIQGKTAVLLVIPHMAPLKL